MKMEQKEREIIRRLRQGKRVNISGIARELGMPVTTVADKIRKIESRHVTKRASLLDYSSMGYNSNQFVALKIKGNASRTSVLDFLKKQRCVNSIYAINSDFHFLVELVFSSHFGFVQWVDEIKRSFELEILSFHVLKTEEKERFLPE